MSWLSLRHCSTANLLFVMTRMNQNYCLNSNQSENFKAAFRIALICREFSLQPYLTHDISPRVLLLKCLGEIVLQIPFIYYNDGSDQ